jgi:hypothetical protein
MEAVSCLPNIQTACRLSLRGFPVPLRRSRIWGRFALSVAALLGNFVIRSAALKFRLAAR